MTRPKFRGGDRVVVQYSLGDGSHGTVVEVCLPNRYVPHHGYRVRFDTPLPSSSGSDLTTVVYAGEYLRHE